MIDLTIAPPCFLKHTHPMRKFAIGRRIALLAMTACAIIWGASLIIAQSALEVVDPLTFMWFRFSLVALFSLPLGVYVLIKRVFTQRQLLIFALIECTNILAMWLVFRGLVATNTLYTSFFLELRPLFVTLGGIFFLKEREEAHEWLGLIIAAIGSLILVLSPLFFMSKLTAIALVPGLLLLLASNVFNMVDLLAIKKHYHHLPKLPLLSTIALIDFALCSLAMVLTRTSPDFSILAQPTVLLPALFMALFVSIIATGLLFFSLDRIEASEAEIFNYLKPFVYVPLAYVVLKETPAISQIVGLAFIISGFVIANRKMTWEKKHTNGRKILKHPHHRM